MASSVEDQRLLILLHSLSSQKVDAPEFYYDHINIHGFSFGVDEHGFAYDEDGFRIAHTDGSRFDIKGFSGIAAGGYAVYWNKGHKANQIAPLRQGEEVDNNVAELRAILLAIKIAKAWGITKLCICTDSFNAIEGLTKHAFKWLQNGWVNKKGQPIRFKTLYCEIIRAMQGMQLKWVFVKGHAGNESNNAADYHARQGAIQHQIVENLPIDPNKERQRRADCFPAVFEEPPKDGRSSPVSRRRGVQVNRRDLFPGSEDD